MGKKKKKKSKKNKKALKALPELVTERAQDVWHAGLAALERAQKEGGEQFDALVARGETLRAKGGDALDAVLGRLDSSRKKAAESAREAAGVVEAKVEAAVEAALAKAGVPPRAEVEALTAEVRALQARLDRLAGAPPTVYRVAPREDGWAVEREGAQQASSRHGTKREALAAGRKLAKANAPSRLVVFRADGSEQDTTAYGD